MNREWQQNRRRQRGFTLIELMVVVVLISILAAIAFPSYSRYVAKSHRRAAQAQMSEIANREQQYFMATRGFADKATLTSNGYLLPADVSPYYSWNVTTTTTGFTITFTPIGSQAEHAVEDVLTLNEAGTKTPDSLW